MSAEWADSYLKMSEKKELCSLLEIDKFEGRTPNYSRKNKKINPTDDEAETEETKSVPAGVYNQIELFIYGRRRRFPTISKKRRIDSR